MNYIYSFPNVQARDLAVTDSRNEAGRLIETGYTLFTVPQMFGSEAGPITLYRGGESSAAKNGMEVLAQYEQESRNHISSGSESFGQVKDNH